MTANEDCRCGHIREAHQHYRSNGSTQCSYTRCRCVSYRVTLGTWLILALRRRRARNQPPAGELGDDIHRDGTPVALTDADLDRYIASWRKEHGRG